MSIFELLQMPVRERKTGLLSVSSDGKQAELTYLQGVLVHAACEDLQGEEAVYPLLAWEEGTFDLDFRPVSAEPSNVRLKIENIIMEGVRRLDERKKDDMEKGGLDDEMTRQLERVLDKVMEDEDLFHIVCVIDQANSKTLVKRERNGQKDTLKQSVAIQLDLINQSLKHVEDDPTEYLLTKTKSHLILTHLLADQLILLVACDEHLPLGQLFLTIRRTVEQMNAMIKEHSQ
jgi:predicted regulator of Ras-like GTPase activity (Roadblock/LC7/MglB family)